MEHPKVERHKLELLDAFDLPGTLPDGFEQTYGLSAATGPVAFPLPPAATAMLARGAVAGIVRVGKRFRASLLA